jgi:outer membrane lipoprotein SlyB
VAVGKHPKQVSRMSASDGRSPIGAVAGFFVGAYLGSSIGFAGSGTAIAGTVPIGLLGSWLGYRYGARVKSAIERICAGDEDSKRDVEKTRILLRTHLTTTTQTEKITARITSESKT